MIKEFLLSYKKIFKILFICYIIFSVSNKIPNLINNIKNLKSSLDNCDGACLIAKNAKSKMECSKKVCKYIYIDTENTGYLYFYQLRYYLSPFESYNHYNLYVYEINNSDENEFFEFIKETDVDYVIVKDNKLLSENKYVLDSKNGKIFKINKNAMNLNNLLLEVK